MSCDNCKLNGWDPPGCFLCDPTVFDDEDARLAGCSDGRPPLPDGWIRCEERMPEVLKFQVALRGAEEAQEARPAGAFHFWLLGECRYVHVREVVAWRPLTVPEEVRKL